MTWLKNSEKNCILKTYDVHLTDDECVDKKAIGTKTCVKL